MRLFLAVNPDEQWRRELATRIDPVCKRLNRCRALRWTRPETWHLTLQFLGDWPDSRIQPLEDALKQAEVGGPFHLVPGTLGAFPDLDRPRVLFLHLDSDGKTENLAQAVRQAVAQEWPDGPQDTKAFRAHLTLARVTGQLEKKDRQVLEELDLGRLPAIRVHDFRLTASIFRSGGADHHEVSRFPLGKA